MVITQLRNNSDYLRVVSLILRMSALGMISQQRYHRRFLNLKPDFHNRFLSSSIEVAQEARSKAMIPIAPACAGPAKSLDDDAGLAQGLIQPDVHQLGFGYLA